MGLLKAFTQGVSSSFGDQFKEMVVCPEIEKNVLIQRGVVKHGSGNTNPTEGVISNGSKIVVPQGMAMMLIENGAIKEFSAEAGEYIWDSGSEPSIFTGGFFKGIGDTLKQLVSVSLMVVWLQLIKEYTMLIYLILQVINLVLHNLRKLLMKNMEC